MFCVPASSSQILLSIWLAVWVFVSLFQISSPMGYTTSNKNWEGLCIDSLGYVVIAAEDGALIYYSTNGGATFTAATLPTGITKAAW